jgi:DNA-binding SARP family transcriptional activator/tetratricopeptide (TPR) repeat protein
MGGTAERTAWSDIRIEALGPLRAFAGEREIDLGAPKQRAAFAVLALCANTVVSKDALIDGIWGESVPMTATGNLHTYVSGLRKAFAELDVALVGSSAGYLLRLDPEALDVYRAERLSSRARTAREGCDLEAAIAALDEALRLWRVGPVLGALPGPFATQQRARLTGMRSRLLVDRAELLIDTGRAADLAETADQLEAEARANPFDERLRAALMMALHRSGRTADALAHYQSLRRDLADHIGIEPDAATRAVHRAILAADVPKATTAPTRSRCPQPPPRPPSPRNCPATARRSSGARTRCGPWWSAPSRARAIRRGSRWSSGSAASARPPSRCAAATCWARPVPTASSISTFVDSIRRTRPCPRPRRCTSCSPRWGSRRFRTSTSSGSPCGAASSRNGGSFILLDNARSAAQVEDLLPGSGTCFVLITSRDRLARIAVKYAARRITLTPLGEDDALGLLADAVGAERVRAEVRAARRLARLCDHLPFALHIAAEQLAASPEGRIAGLVENLEDAQSRLDTLQLDYDEFCSVRGVMSCSIDALDAEAARACRLLGAFPGESVTEPCAAALFDTPEQHATGDVLRRLSAQHLLEQHGDRYGMHDLTRAYLGELSRELPDEQIRAARDRVRGWYLATMSGMVHDDRTAAAGIAPDPRRRPKTFADQGEFLRWCAAEYPNISAVIRSSARTADHRFTWQLTYLLFDYFHATGSAAEWLDLLQVAMRAATACGDRRAHALLLDHSGVALTRLGRADEAAENLVRGLALLEGDAGDAARTTQIGLLEGDGGAWAARIGLLCNLASVLCAAGQHDVAERTALEAAALAADPRGGPYHRAIADDTLAALYLEQGRWTEAKERAHLALQGARACGDLLLEAGLHVTLSLAHGGLTEGAAARDRLAKALLISTRTGDRYHEGLALLALARLRAAADTEDGPERTAAVDLAHRALSRLRELAANQAGDVIRFLGDLYLQGSVAG